MLPPHFYIRSCRSENPGFKTTSRFGSEYNEIIYLLGQYYTAIRAIRAANTRSAHPLTCGLSGSYPVTVLANISQLY